MNRTIWLSLVLVVGCAGKGMDEWTKQPRNAVTSEILTVKMTADIWQGMWTVPPPSTDSKEYRYQRDVGGSLVDQPPDFTFTLGGPDTLDAFVAGLPKSTSWLRRDQQPDGYLVTFADPRNPGRGIYVVYRHRVVGATKMNCMAIVGPWEVGGDAKDEVPLIEDACRSLRLGDK